ncbi:sensor domain-containing diguanylate cyclase [Sphingomonas sp. RB3P16]|uniref:GGDEF domain-containing protein n=1 Tax=Parasphingomonas frigoris TaxID=3096163 RepID=UPI002FC8A72C
MPTPSATAPSRWWSHFNHAERLSDTGSWRLDLATTTMEWTPQAFCIFGLDPHGGVPTLDRALEFYPPKDRELLMQAIDRAIDSGKPYEIETYIVSARGEHRRIRNIGEVERINGAPAYLIGVCQDVTAQHHIEKALERTALSDELTGLANRAALNRFLAQHIERGNRDRAFAVLLLDLDNFKAVNDTFGHHAGDDVLQRVAAVLAAHADRIGFAARLGGDEFVLCITDPATVDALRAYLETLLRDLVLPVDGEASTIVVGATVGACRLDEEIMTRSEILQRADLSLYNAKALGKGRAMVAGDLRPILPGQGGEP